MIQTAELDSPFTQSAKIDAPLVVFNRVAQAHTAQNGVVYYPFVSDDEAQDWIDAASADWWDDEAI